MAESCGLNGVFRPIYPQASLGVLEGYESNAVMR
jgi:hypothetical protein